MPPRPPPHFIKAASWTCLWQALPELEGVPSPPVNMVEIMCACTLLQTVVHQASPVWAKIIAVVLHGSRRLPELKVRRPCLLAY
mmetsp:Transcript_3817/g.10330  ORF Transcript_3817/g.10330 Transcript_3817/m.10330 type:complete len:84 (+) Transcript_3817:509-760(+)